VNPVQKAWHTSRVIVSAAIDVPASALALVPSVWQPKYEYGPTAGLFAGPVEVACTEVAVDVGSVAVDVGFVDVDVVVGFVDVDVVVSFVVVEVWDVTVVYGGKTTLLLKSYTSNRLPAPQNSDALPLQSILQSAKPPGASLPPF
jgi:hypothetical protein